MTRSTKMKHVNVFAHDIADYIMGNNPIGFN